MQDTDLPEKIEPTSLNLQTELAAQLAELVPEAMSDGKLDVTKLRELVNGDAENSPEKFGLFWPGKRAAQTLAQIPTSATLVPAPDESVDWGTTKNIFIEGDNLEVLKTLQNSYRRKVKMIYIDPPYNTDQDFVYPDKFSEGLQGYLEYTGQKNEAGENVESKPETGGRKHSNWLSMMYPRLQLAKSLMSDEGVIFISINDIEQSNLRSICDEVFGAENFVGNLIWEKKKKGAFLSGKVTNVKEYIICYSRSTSSFEGLVGEINYESGTYPVIKSTNSRGVRIIRAGIKSKYKLTDHYVKSGTRISAGNQELILLSDLHIEKGILMADVEIDSNWIYSQKLLDEYAAKDELYITQDLYFRRIVNEPRKKMMRDLLLRVGTSGKSGDKFILSEDLGVDGWGTNEDGNAELHDLLGIQNLLEFPKPSKLISKLIYSLRDQNLICLDFFSGSGTTAQAIMQLNALDNGNRIHIQVQLPELTKLDSEAYKAGYKNIADISKERIRRAGKKIREDHADTIAQRNTPLDTGFRVYKLAPSNFVQWDENKAKDDIQQSVLDFAANKKPDAAPESLLTEIMLQARMPLSANIEKRDLQNGGWVYVVDGGNLIAYVAEEQITEAQANEIAELAPAKLIVLDSAFNGNNALKINVMNICKEKFIKEFKTI